MSMDLDYVSDTEIRVGDRYVDTDSGEVLIVALPRKIAGGYVVDVESDLPHVKGFRWTACVCNLRHA